MLIRINQCDRIIFGIFVKTGKGALLCSSKSWIKKCFCVFFESHGTYKKMAQYKVAALGNITTLPKYRGKGYGTRVTARLCQSLIDGNLDIGLNVKDDNEVAIICYRKIGFETVASYEEFMMHRKQ